ncbi:MAG: response regulator [Desulfobacteraceae bacterium]|nr:response regulator [Desulfobacteraceae bacterium]
MVDKKRILVVDDEPDFCSIIQGNLERDGFEVEIAYDGVEGLDKVRQNPPDAIILDVMMPEKDGYEVCRELKNDENFASIPILMLTAVSSLGPSTRYSQYDRIELDADGYLSKPASAEKITASLKGLLNLP